MSMRFMAASPGKQQTVDTAGVNGFNKIRFQSGVVGIVQHVVCNPFFFNLFPPLLSIKVHLKHSLEKEPVRLAWLNNRLTSPAKPPSKGGFPRCTPSRLGVLSASPGEGSGLQVILQAIPVKASKKIAPFYRGCTVSE
jgi:hypothetical protein